MRHLDKSIIRVKELCEENNLIKLHNGMGILEPYQGEGG